MADKVNPIQVQKFLAGVDYPCTKDDLISMAEEAGADDMIIEKLRSLNRNNFNSPNDVSEAIGEMNNSSMEDDAMTEDEDMDEDMDDEEDEDMDDEEE